MWSNTGTYAQGEGPKEGTPGPPGPHVLRKSVWERRRVGAGVAIGCFEESRSGFPSAGLGKGSRERLSSANWTSNAETPQGSLPAWRLHAPKESALRVGIGAMQLRETPV